MGSWNTGGTMLEIQTKMGEGQLPAHEIPLYPMENYVNGKLFDKNMKFCILVIHDLTNDISYGAKVNRSKNCYFGGKIVKILWKKNRKKWENICIIHICWYIGIKFCTVVVHTLNKDISYDSKLNESKKCHFWEKYSNSVLNCLSFIIIPLDS